jgi:hypothetical protein
LNTHVYFSIGEHCIQTFTNRVDVICVLEFYDIEHAKSKRVPYSGDGESTHDNDIGGESTHDIDMYTAMMERAHTIY